MGDGKLIFSVPIQGYSQKVEPKKYSKETFKSELYNLRDDIGETKKLHKDHPKSQKKLLKRARAEAAKLDRGYNSISK